eukprot:396881_1
MEASEIGNILGIAQPKLYLNTINKVIQYPKTTIIEAIQNQKDEPQCEFVASKLYPFTMTTRQMFISCFTAAYYCVLQNIQVATFLVIVIGHLLHFTISLYTWNEGEKEKEIIFSNTNDLRMFFGYKLDDA